MLRQATLFTLALSGISAAQADGLTPVGPASADVRLCYASGSSGPQVPCVLQGQTWIQLLRPVDDVSNTTSTAGDNTRARLLKDRAADTLNLLDFVPQGVSEADIRSGAGDALPAFVAARDSRPAGSAPTIIVPAGTYRLSGNFGNNGRVVHVDMSSGASVGASRGGGGPGILYVSRITYRRGAGIATETMGTATADARAIGIDTYVTNNGGNSGTGEQFTYHNYNYNNGSLSNGGDVSRFTAGQWHNMAGSAFLTWDVGITPVVPNSEITAPSPRGFAMVGKEINLAHNGPTGQWTEHDPRQTGNEFGAPVWDSVGIQIVPDSWTPTGRQGGHNTVGYMVGPDAFINNRTDGPGGVGYINGTFSPFHIANDATAPGGRGMYYGGSTATDPARLPYAGIEVRHKWPMFLNLEKAELTSGWIVNAVPGQSYRWSTAAGDVTIGATSTGKAVIAAPGGLDLPATPWVDYTPSQTGAVGGTGATFGTVFGRHQVTGKRLDVSISIPITTAGTGNAYIYTTLPSGMVSRNDCVLTGAEMANVTGRTISGRLYSGTSIIGIFNADATYPGANGARLSVNGSCELQ